jgi:hypothetical protein
MLNKHLLNDVGSQTASLPAASTFILKLLLVVRVVVMDSSIKKHDDTHLDVIIEDQVMLPVPLQQCQSVLHFKIFKLQHSVGPACHDSSHKLHQNRQQQP